MNTLNTTVTSEADVPEEKAIPVQDERPAETVIEEGKTVGTPFADDPKFKLRNVEVFYGEDRAIKNISLDIARNEVIAFIGPSGCGKSTFLRCLNRMNDSIDICRVKGGLELDDEDIYDSRRDVVELRARPDRRRPRPRAGRSPGRTPRRPRAPCAGPAPPWPSSPRGASWPQRGAS